MSGQEIPKSSLIDKFKRRAGDLKREVYAFHFAYRDPRVPWYGKVVLACLLAYAFSPIDLIPDFIPVLGYLDDLVLIPLLVFMALRIIPGPVMKEAREKSISMEQKPRSWLGAVLIVLAWLVAAGMLIRLML